jgi:NitT/TauT family transport system substrate-binding protein
LSEGQVDAALCYAMNEPVQMQAAGQAVDVIYVSDYANLVSNGLITNEKTLQARADLVQGMVRAALRGLAYTLDHPDEAFDISLQHVPEAAADAEVEAVNRAILQESITFWRADAGKLGYSEEADWLLSQQIMCTMGLLSVDHDLSTTYTNRFVAEIEP